MKKLPLFLSALLFSFVLGVSGLARAEEAGKTPPPAAGAECPCKQEGAKKDCAKNCPHKAKGDCPCAKGGDVPTDCPCQRKGDKAKG